MMDYGMEWRLGILYDRLEVPSGLTLFDDLRSRSTFSCLL